MSLYDQDFYQWTQEQAALLKSGLLSQLDVTNLIEEIESMGRSEKRELVNRLVILIAHLLKWDCQPERRGWSWELTIKEQRLKLNDHINDNPSLQAIFDDAVISAYRQAIVKAMRETGLPEAAFPGTCPYTIKQLIGNVTQ